LYTLESNHKQLLDELHGKAESEKDERDGYQATLTERLDFLERMVGESADDLDELHEKYQGDKLSGMPIIQWSRGT